MKPTSSTTQRIIATLICGLVGCGEDATPAPGGAPQLNDYEAYYEAYGRVVQRHLCRLAFECPEGIDPSTATLHKRFPSLSACTDPSQPQISLIYALEAIEEGVSAGRQRFNPEAAAACIAGLDALVAATPRCEQLFLGFLALDVPACEEITEGLVPTGGGCVEVADCAGPNARCVRASFEDCAGTCQPEPSCETPCAADEVCRVISDERARCVKIAREGEDCGGSDTECDETTSCEFVEEDQTSRCMAPDERRAKRGEACVALGEGPRCDVGLRCFEDGCGENTVLGEGLACSALSEDSLCTPGTICLLDDAEAQTGRCGAPLGRGAPCFETGECQIGLACDITARGQRGVCGALKPLGAPCAEALDCESKYCELGRCAVLGTDFMACMVPE